MHPHPTLAQVEGARSGERFFSLRRAPIA